MGGEGKKRQENRLGPLVEQNKIGFLGKITRLKKSPPLKRNNKSNKHSQVSLNFDDKKLNKITQ